MESQPQNPEFRYNPENLHQCIKAQTKLLASSFDGHVIIGIYYRYLYMICVYVISTKIISKV